MNEGVSISEPVHEIPSSVAPTELWVCWSNPTVVREGLTMLSFLPPSIEEELEKGPQCAVIRARETVGSVRAKARELYLGLVARIGTVTAGGLTFRQALARPSEVSRWWFHPAAFRDCESDPTFQWIIAVLTIRAVAEQYGTKKLVLVGCPRQVSAVLKGAFTVEEVYACRSPRSWWLWLRGFGSRTSYAVRTLRQWIAVHRWTEVPQRSFDVVFSGFWDWSVRQEAQDGSFTDRYFKRLPEELRSRGTWSCGWLAWLDPDGDPSRRWRTLKNVLAPLKDRHDVVLLQSFLRPVDILRAILDFRPFLLFLRMRNRTDFRVVFRTEGLDYYPLFGAQLLAGFVNASLPHGELVALAAERACLLLRPKVSLSFLEHFPYSRAYYAGVRRAGTGTLCVAVQHASYNHEKTFLFIDPKVEFRGDPDGCAVPHPDYVCAMGTLGEELFLECGYPKDRVVVTGSPRYDGIRFGDGACPVSAGEGHGAKDIHLLIVTSLAQSVELDMVEAVCAAVRGISGIQVWLREHPLSLISEYPGFAPFRDRVQITNGSLQEDLACADVILFTYSTVAEEAFLQGKTVWQWLPQGFNGSALSETVPIPQFGSVAGLRKALKDFQCAPNRFAPSVDVRQLALTRLFYKGDGGAASRISVVLSRLLAEAAEPDGQNCLKQESAWSVALRPACSAPSSPGRS